MSDVPPATLHALLAAAGLPTAEAADRPVTGVTADSRTVTTGSVFVAIPGTRVDGHRFIADAARAGAAAVVAERPPDAPPDSPVVVVADARRAIAHLGAAWYGHPAARLPLVGITGTVGKTSVLTIMEAILKESGLRVGSIGSLGMRVDGETLEESSYTVPEPLMLHRQLARLADAHCDLAVMEVTSHALVQQRVAGLQYAAGVFTNLVPLEHAEFHRNFRAYVEAKARFFDHLVDRAPLVYNADDRAVRRIVQHRGVLPVSCGHARTAMVRVEAPAVTARGTQLVLDVRRPLPRISGESAPAVRLPLQLQLIGRSNVTNVTLGAAAALAAGASADAVQRALTTLPAARRRMEIVHSGDFVVLDDTVGHPDSVSVVFETVERLAPRRVHVVWAVRGQRGGRINRYNAEALAIWTHRVPLASLVVTRSHDTTDERNRVQESEYDAFLRPLRTAGVSCETAEALRPAITAALARARAGDLVLLLGAQGMNAGAGIARAWLGARGIQADARNTEPRRRSD